MGLGLSLAASRGDEGREIDPTPSARILLGNRTPARGSLSRDEAHAAPVAAAAKGTAINVWAHQFPTRSKDIYPAPPGYSQARTLYCD